jgi:exodeoxyribonuclease VII large subunit
MKKGYSIVYKDDNIISSSKDLNSDDEIMIKMSDGNVFAKVK